MKRRRCCAMLIFGLVGSWSALGRAEDAPSIASEPPEAAVPHPKLFLTPRFGVMSLRGSSSSRYFAPSVGVGFEYVPRRFLALSLWSDASLREQGTSEVGVRRITSNTSALVEGRLWLGRAASLRLGAGPGVAALAVTTMLRETSDTVWTIEPGIAWKASFDIALPSERVAFTFGSGGLWHALSHDVLVFAGASFALD